MRKICGNVGHERSSGRIMGVDGDAHVGERSAKIAVAMQRDDATRLIVFNFDTEKLTTVKRTLVFDLEAGLEGGFESFEGGEIRADDEDVVDVRGEERDNAINAAKVDAGVTRAAGKSEGEDETV